MQLAKVAREGIRSFRETQRSLEDQEKISQWCTATRTFCAEPRREEAPLWFKALANEVVNFPAEAIKEVVGFQWYRTFGDGAILQSYSEFILALSAACGGSSHVLTILNTLIGFLSTPHQFPAGSQVTVGTKVLESQQAVKVACRELLNHYIADTEGNKTLNEEHFNFVRALLEHHPRKEKLAKGCTAIGVAKHPIYPHNCFFLQNTDGGWEDFSYRRCAENLRTPNFQTQRHICMVIGHILRLSPSFTLSTARMLEERMPNSDSQWMDIQDHRNYLQALLYLAESCVLTEPLLRFVLKNLGTLDCEVAELEDNLPIMPNEESLDRSAQLLDAQMGVVLEFLHSRLGRNNGSSEQQKKEVSRMAKLTIAVFEEMTFMLHRTRHVQFIYFYICSLSPAWAEDFLVRLLRVLYEDTQSVEKRKQAQNYLGSIIVRGKFLSTKFSLQTTRYLIEWLNEQLENMVNRSPFGVDGYDPKWLMFHQSVEVVLYVLCWKTEEFAHAQIEDFWDRSEGSRTPLQVLFTGPEYTSSDKAPKCRLSDVLNHRSLRPTARICPTVLRRFIKRMDKVVLDQEWWHTLRQTIAGGPLRDDQQVTDTMFAFDPFRLRNSHAFIKNIYRTWEELEPDGAKEDADEARGFELEAQLIEKFRKMENDYDGRSEISSSSSSHQSGIEDVDMAHASPSPSFCPRREIPEDADLQQWSLPDKVKRRTSIAHDEDDDDYNEYDEDEEYGEEYEEYGEEYDDAGKPYYAQENHTYDDDDVSIVSEDAWETDEKSSEMEEELSSPRPVKKENLLFGRSQSTDLMSTYISSMAYANGVKLLQERPVYIGKGKR